MLVLTGGDEDQGMADTSDARLTACGIDRLGDVVGRQLDRVEIPEDIIHRIVRPGTPMTRDYRPARLNVMVDAGGRVTEVFCG